MTQPVTQDQCKAEWQKLKAEMLERIDRLDRQTPEGPTTEPQWWLDMMEIDRLLRKVS